MCTGIGGGGGGTGSQCMCNKENREVASTNRERGGGVKEKGRGERVE